MDLCFGARPELCDRLIRDASGALIQVNLVPTNINELRTSGVDTEVAYRRSMFGGTMTFRGLTSYQPTFQETDTIGTNKIAGSIGGITEGQPNLKGNLSVGYETGPYSLTAAMRYIGEAKLRNEWVEGIDIDDNTIERIAFLDLRGSYDFEVGGVQTRFSFSIDNLLNTDPRIIPATPSTVPYGASSPSTRMDLYDALGRRYRIGFRAKF